MNILKKSYEKNLGPDVLYFPEQNALEIPFRFASFTMYFEQILEGYQRSMCSGTGSDSHCSQWDNEDGVLWLLGS